MGFSEWSKNVFSGNSFEEEKPDYHTITTDHPWMIQIGLGAFTTGVLQKWWDEKDQNGDFKNRKLFGPGFFGGPFSLARITSPFDDSKGHHFESWRQNERNYIEYNNVSEAGTNWEFSEIKNGQTRSHTWADIGFTSFNNTLYTTLDFSNDPENTADVSHQNIDTFLCNIIEINNYVRLKKIYTPDETTWLPFEGAASEFIRDIKSAKNGGGVSWSGYLPFVFNVNDATNCTKWDWVKFKLQLFDNNRPKQSARPLGVSDFNIVGTPIDVLGQSYANRSKEDGEFDAASINGDVGSQVAGGVDMSYNEYTGKWQSGTPQIIARLTTDIPSAANESNVEPTVEGLQGAAIKDLLDKNNAAYHHAQTGEAMPISMQNGNPLQWAPQYAEPRGCRQNENKKTVTVVNLAPRAWTSGQMVVLNKIDGVWFPLEFGAAPDIAIPSVFEGKWDFTYLMTNGEYFFSKANDSNEANPYSTFWYYDYEKLYYKKYYGTAGVNAQAAIDDFQTMKGGFAQTTSFDFMSDHIGGTRVGQGHAIAQTQAAIGVDGEPLGENGDGRGVRPIFSAPFYGCVFPGGYNGEKIFSLYNQNGIQSKVKADGNNSSFLVDSTNTASNASPFFSDAYNENVNDGTENGTKGIFATNNSNLIHLPADIALNASPSGTNGRPISSINWINKYIGPSVSDPVDSAASFFEDAGGPKRYAWAYKEAVSDNTFTKYDSTWDLSPKNSNIIQFRPLMTEVYASFEHSDGVGAQNQVKNERGEFGARAWQMVGYGSYPLSRFVLHRARDAGSKLNDPGFGPSTKSFRYTHGDLSANGADANAILTDDKVSDLWRRSWNDTNNSAGALGIISAVCTCGANSKITFNADCYLGMQSYFINGQWIQTFGGGNRPQDLNMTMLYARVFTAWPRDLTVYDARYFSVFHFNYGAGVDTQGDKWHFNGSLVSDQSTVPASPAVDYPSQFYKVDESYSNVDYRIPTWTDGDDPIVGTVTDNDPILGVIKIVKNSKLRQAKDWKIYGTVNLTAIDPANGAQRRGKLLPINGGYNYKKRTIGIQVGPTTVFNAFSAASPIIAEAKDYDIMIVNPGSNYANGNTFKVSNANGSSVLLKALTNGGQITGFEIADSPVTLANGTTLSNPQTGVDFQPADFLDHDDILDGTKKPSAKITAVEATGADFEGYFVRGWVQDSPILTDYGPKDAIDGFKQLSPNQPLGDTSAITRMINETKTVEANIVNKAEDNRYDVYLWMKNDITHSFADNQSSATQVIEQQFINLEILPE